MRISRGTAPQILSCDLFDADTGIDAAREIREYFIPDFSEWKELNSYQRAFNRLIRDLQPQSSAPAGTGT